MALDTKANAGNLRNGTPEQLHMLLDRVEKKLDDFKSEREDITSRVSALEQEGRYVEAAQFGEIKTTVDKTLGTLDEIKGRLDHLDKVLPVGEKVYQPIVKATSVRGEEARKEFAYSVLDHASIVLNQRPRFGSKLFCRTQSDGMGTGTNPVTGATNDVLVDGGYMFAPEYSWEIIWIVQSYGIARRLCRMVRMNAPQWTIPLAGDLPDVFWDTQIDGRGQRDLDTFTTSPYDKAGPNAPNAKELYAPQESKVVFGNKTMTAHKLTALDTMSIELSQDSVPDIANFIVDQFAIAVAKEEDYQLLISPGTGNEPFTGLMAVSGMTEVTTNQTDYMASLADTALADGAYAKLLELYDAPDESTAANSVFVMSKSILNGTRLVRTTTGEPLYASMVGPNGTNLFGQGVETSRIMPKMKDAGDQSDTPFILYGDFRYQVMGDRMQLSFDTDKSVEFRRGGIVLRLMERIAFLNLSLTPFARLKTKAGA